jgi:hypothetical protein
MIKVTTKPRADKFFGRLKRYWADDPEQFLSVVRQWWWDEAWQTFMSKGARVGSRWKRVTPRWQKRKSGRTPNVNTGRLRRAMTGKGGHWSRIRKSKAEVGVMYEGKIVGQLDKWRTLAETKPKQMAALDVVSQEEIDRFDRTLQ